jgi:Concanavalin A-like lectin/glucanases superfamily/Fibronectin type III domain/Putative Ig domain
LTNVIVRVTDNSGVSASTTGFTWNIVAKPTITSPSSQTHSVGSPVSLTLTKTCPNSPCSYVLNNGPGGLSITSAGVITGVITGPAQTFPAVTVTITDNSNVSVNSPPFLWTVLAAPSVTTPSAQTTTVGATVSLAVAFTCADTPCAFTLANAPPGLSINAASGVISGSPTLTGTYAAVSVTITDVDGSVATTANFTWTVLAAPTITTPSAQTTTVGTAVSLAVASTCPGSPCSYVLSNAPAGLTINSSGLITGTVASAPQVFNTVTVTVTDKAGVSATTANFTWTVTAAPTVTKPAAQTSAVGATVNLTLTKSCPNTPCSYVLNNGPAGLTITSAGVVNGTITSAAQVFANVTITVTDNSGVSASSAAFTWTIVARPTVTAPANQTDSVGSPVSLTLTKTCPNVPCSYVLNNGPAGLVITSAGVVTGTITGTAQVFNNVTITITDNSGVAANSATFTWTVLAGPTVTTPPAQTTTIGATVSLTVGSTCADAPCRFTLANAPPGLSINSSGVISGTVSGPAQAYNAVAVTITDVDGATATTANFTWTVTGPPTISSPGSQTLVVGQGINFTIGYTCPNGPCTFATTNIPPGISIDNQGNVSGSPTTVGTYNVTITITDASGIRASTGAFTVAVIAPPSAPTSPAAAAGNTQITVSWSAPTNTNGSAITGYTATSTPGGATCTPSPATATACTITGLQNGTSYQISITATNAAGTGPPSAVVSATPMASCTSVAGGNGGFNAYLAYPLNEASGLIAADVSGNARPGTYTSSGITYGAPGPCPRDGGKAVTLNGSSGYISSNVAPINPQIFSVAIWFKTTVAGGKLIGLGNAKTGASGQYDRHIYMTNAGTLAFGVYPNGTTKTITSPLAYNNGGWHQVIATLAPSTDANPGMRLYVDGRLVVADSTTTGAEPLSNASYWRIGYDSTSGWPGAPTNSFFTGSLAFAATYTYAVTPVQALAQYNAGV